VNKGGEKEKEENGVDGSREG
jgi:hypothetical protein